MNLGSLFNVSHPEVKKMKYPKAVNKFCGKEIEYVTQALQPENKEYNSVSWVQRFEEAFAEKMGVEYAIACNSGTSGLHAALYAAGVGPGDEVIGPGLTVVMDAFATLHLGGVPVFVDVCPKRQTIDPNAIERAITSKTKAIIVVTLQGLPVDMDPIMEIAERHNIKIIEDNAQALLAKYKGRYTGTIGHINVFSFENKKHMTSGSEGGMIVTNDEELAVRARKFGGIGYKHMSGKAGRTSLALSTAQDPNYLRFDTMGLNYRMNEVSAAVGLAQLERLDEIIGLRREVGRIFTEAVKDCDWLTPQEIPAEYESTFYTFSVVYTGDLKFGVTWREFYRRYLDIGGDGFYGACMNPYLEPVFTNMPAVSERYGPGSCPNAEAIQQRIMQFKTNYRDLNIAQDKANKLRELIDLIEKKGG